MVLKEEPFKELLMCFSITAGFLSYIMLTFVLLLATSKGGSITISTNLYGEGWFEVILFLGLLPIITAGVLLSLYAICKIKESE